jgi:histidine phosphotransferase ChpT
MTLTNSAMDAVDFAALLCSRLCHDLLSPVGAMNNGLELLAGESDPMMQKQVVSLLNDSASSSANKLKFFRLAFGAAGGFDSEIDANEAKQAIEGLFVSTGKISLGWAVTPPTLGKPAIKVLLNLALIAGDALVRGGRMEVGAEVRDGVTEIVVKAEGDRVILDPEIRKALLGEVPGNEVAPRGAGAWLAHQLVQKYGGSIQASPTDSPFLLFGATVGK